MYVRLIGTMKKTALPKRHKDYASLLEKARRDRAAVGAESVKLDRRMKQLDSLIMALRSLVESPAIDPAKGLTEGIKTALQLALPNGLFPMTLRATLEQSGFDFSKQVNPMASIHAILKRMMAKDMIHATDKGDGKGAFYVWNTPEYLAYLETRKGRNEKV